MDYKEKYRILRPKHEEFTSKVHSLIKELLNDNDIKTQNIECRTKTVESFLEKIDREGKSYTDPLNEMTDLSGIRIILYYLDDIEKVEKLFNTEFKVDSKNSINKKEVLDFDQFGYLSVHQIITLKNPRMDLSEWKKFKGFTAEIQIRTVLQHAWASISHALQYKSESDIPKELRRQLHRLSGLFELADEEFLQIKEKKNKIIDAINSSIETNKFEIPVNIDSLKSYFESSEVIKLITKNAYKSGFKTMTDTGGSQLSILNKVLKELGIDSIEKLDRTLIALEKNSEEKYKKFVKDYNSKASPEHLIALFLVITYKDKIPQKNLKNLVGWSQDYINRL